MVVSKLENDQILQPDAGTPLFRVCRAAGRVVPIRVTEGPSTIEDIFAAASSADVVATFEHTAVIPIDEAKVVARELAVSAFEKTTRVAGRNCPFESPEIIFVVSVFVMEVIVGPIILDNVTRGEI